MDNNLIDKYKGLVVNIARRYTGNGLDLDDLIQEGYIGLLTAHNKYKPDKDTKFTTYAYYWIKQSIIRAIENTGSLIRVPSYRNNLSNSGNIGDITSTLQKSIGNDDNISTLQLTNKIKDILSNKDDYKLFMEYYVEGLSYRKLGTRYNKSHVTIKNKLDTLLKIVQDKLTT